MGVEFGIEETEGSGQIGKAVQFGQTDNEIIDDRIGQAGDNQHETLL